MERRAFVTGATGLLGNNLVRALLAGGHSVRALVRSDLKAQRLLGGTGAELVYGDMGDVRGFADALEGCDTVFHTAAYFREYYGPGDHWPALVAINVSGTLALAEAARARGVRRFVDTSSAGIIGRRADGSPGDEDTPPAPIARTNLYLKSKYSVAAGLRAMAPRAGLDIVQVLPGWMFGPFDAAPTASGRFVLDFLDGRLPGIPPGGISAVDARDVAAGMILAAERGRTGQRYILGGAFATLADVAAALERVTGLPAPRKRIPYALALAFAAFAQTRARITGAETPVTVAGVRMMHAGLEVSSAKAERELGWRHRPLVETLRDEVLWYRSRGFVKGPAPTRAVPRALEG